jgi:WhiB family transcriptional regulator, redox-sensing transcriptional regulator
VAIVFRTPSRNTWSLIHPKTDGRRINDQEAGDSDMSMALTCREKTLPAVPCHVGDPDLWFAEDPADLERAKALCAECPIRRECLAAALERQEPWGVWGGEILDRGVIVARKRPRGRPRKNTEVSPAAA